MASDLPFSVLLRWYIWGLWNICQETLWKVIGLRLTLKGPHYIPCSQKELPFSQIDINLFDFSETPGKNVSLYHVVIIILIRILFSLETLPVYTTSKIQSF